MVCFHRPRKEILRCTKMSSHHCSCWPRCRTALVRAQQTPDAPASSDTAADTAAIDQVTVVGSRARNRTVFDSAVPIDRFGAREVENALSSGEVGAALQALSPSINFPRIESSGACRLGARRAAARPGAGPGAGANQRQTPPRQRRTGHRKQLCRHRAGRHQRDSRRAPSTTSKSCATAPARNTAAMPWPASSTSCSSSSAPAARLRSATAPTTPTSSRPTRRRPTARPQIVNADYGVPLGDAGFFRFGAESRSRNPTQRAGFSDAGWTSWNYTPADQALDGKVVFKSGDSQSLNNYLFYNALLPSQRRRRPVLLRHRQPAQVGRQRLLPLSGRSVQRDIGVPSRLPSGDAWRRQRHQRGGRRAHRQRWLELGHQRPPRQQHLPLRRQQLAQRLARRAKPHQLPTWRRLTTARMR